MMAAGDAQTGLLMLRPDALRKCWGLLSLARQSVSSAQASEVRLRQSAQGATETPQITPL